jgi:hypothetical protein
MPVREALSTRPKSRNSHRPIVSARFENPASPSQTAATIDQSSKVLRWLGWRRLPAARPPMEAAAIQLPPVESGAKTCRMPTAVLSTPAATSAMQNAWNAGRWPPWRCVRPPINSTAAAAAVMPAEESDNVTGSPVQRGAASAANASNPNAAKMADIAPSGSSLERAGKALASTISQPPQPTNETA